MSKIFTSSVVFDSQIKAWREDFWIDGKSVDGDTYYSEIENETDKINQLKEYDCINCDDCSICEVELDDLLDIYADRLADVGGCPSCNKAVLIDFVDELADLVEE